MVVKFLFYRQSICSVGFDKSTVHALVYYNKQSKTSALAMGAANDITRSDIW